MTSDNQIAQNRKAHFEYFLETEYEAGLALLGSEVKSIRAHKVNLNEAYVIEKGGELFLYNAHISEYHSCGAYFNHAPRRERKLLLHRHEINRLIGKMRLRGMTVVPISMYINKHNLVKLKIALAKGKHLYDKRASIKDRECKRETDRMLKHNAKDLD